jgi:uncharacterized protein YecT (DUF1311 family)
MVGLAGRSQPDDAGADALASGDQARVPVVVAPVAPPAPPPRAPGRLQTLPPDMAAAAGGQTPPPQTASNAPDDAAARPPEPAAAAEPNPEPPPAAPYRTSFDCGTARPGAEEMVCEDPALAAADRRMARAYRHALDAGADPDALRHDQREWAAVREDAAFDSPGALAQVYAQRIRELNQIADSAGADQGYGAGAWSPNE